jgi:hypothetical protein
LQAAKSSNHQIIQSSNLFVYPSTVPSSTPVRDGFRAVFRRPSIILAEISWRWCFGAALWALLALSFIEYARSLDVSNLEWLMWRSGFPPFMLQALGRVIDGSGFKLLRIAAILLPACAALWTIAASFGRTATVRAMTQSDGLPFRTALGLSFFRAALALAFGLSVIGIYLMAARSYVNVPGQLPHAGRAFAILIIATAVAWYIWAVANWVLSVAPLLAAVERRDSTSAIAATVGALSVLSGRFMRVGWAYGAIHFFAFVVFTGMALVVMGFSGILPGDAVFVLLVLITLAYFVLADCLYMARLASYAALLDCLSVEPANVTSTTNV